MGEQPGIVTVAADEGRARNVLGSIDIVKVTARQSGGLLGLIEWKEAKGGGPPLHVHSREDEAYYIVSGAVTFFIGDRSVPAPAGTFVFAPKGAAHSWRVDSDEATGLQLMLPGGFESFFLDTFPAADETTEAIDLERVASAAAEFGVTILGPQPEGDSPPKKHE